MPEYDFSDKVAFVTGAAHGQGRSHARTYAENGADVVITDICEDISSNPYELGTGTELDRTAELVRKQGQEALTLEMDVREEPEVAAAVEQALDHFGRIDILANNAGILNAGELIELDEETWDDVIDVNLKGVWLCSKYVGQHFADRDDGGKIVSTSSTSGMLGSWGSGHYAAAKWGVRGLTKSLALELAQFDVNVNCVCPTGVDTPMIEGNVEAYSEEKLEEMARIGGKANIFDSGMITPRDVSEAYMWLSSDAARYVTGIELPVDAGYTAK